MKKSITQEFEYGCGVACWPGVVCNLSYRQAAKQLGREKSVKYGWKPSDLVKALNGHELSYRNRYVRKQKSSQIYPEGTVVLIERSMIYPVGHYLIQHSGRWMDPWINLPLNANITHAKSGYRERLPGKPMYALIPVSRSSPGMQARYNRVVIVPASKE